MIIHPGFLKTATTTLQDHLFATHPDLFPLGLPHRSEIQTRIAEEFRKIDGVDYDEEKLRLFIHTALEDKLPNTILVLSDESFTANAFLLQPIAQRLCVFFPDAHILFTIRHQLDSIRSFYARHGRVLTNAPAPYTDRHITFPNWLAHAYHNRPTSYLGLIDYHRTIEIYEQVFGRERIHILLFEDLKYDRAAFVDQIADVLSVDASTVERLLSGEHAHRQESARFVLYDRLMKRFIPKSWLRSLLPYTARLHKHTRAFLRSGAPKKITIPPTWIPRLEKLYQSGNRALAETYNLPLAQYDYP